MAICYEVERFVSSRPSTERQRVATVLKDLRQKAGISQEELAPRVGLTLAGYRPYERGKRDLSFEQVPVFAGALNVTAAELLTLIGLPGMSLRSVHAAEAGALVEQAPPPVAEEMLAVLRSMTRIASAATQSADGPR